ncbi:MAG: right-handed parallel beta-helix repeat-containing protein, partial [Thermoplasmata archaeon]|nr:right-handed parallel beta-helix repeat-containing protein [Thermoplasmata archaeon]
MKETKFRTLKNPDTGKQREARVIQRGRKIGSVIVVSIMFAMSFAVCFSMSAEALEFVEPMTMPWTTAFEPMDSAWDSTGNHCVIIGNDTSGIQSSAWYYNAGANTTVPILEGSDPTMTPINIVENANTSIQYGTIQAALDAASSGNILNVWAGTYNENIVIGKALTLTGNGSANTIINGGGSGNAVTIKASGVKFNGFNVTGGASAGILLYTVQNCTIENDTVVGNGDGIYLKGSSNNIIKNNNVKNNALGLRTANSTATKSLVGLTNSGGAADSGAMFKMTPSGLNYSIMHDFKAGYIDGRYPYYTQFIKDIYNVNILYGTTANGGTYDYGTVFRINTDGSAHTVLHKFKGGATDGSYPYGGLVQDGTALYGMTCQGGASNMGTLFRINTDGSDFTLLHSFAGGATDGSNPYGSLILDGAALFGMTYQGGASSMGTIFSINIDGSSFTMLHSFNGTKFDGSYPYASLT